MANKIVKILDFNPKYLEIFAEYKKMINEILPNDEVILVGSAAIPMKGKEEIDIMVITKNIVNSYNKLGSLGFKKGPIEEKLAFLHDYKFNIECEIHLVLEGSKKIKNVLSFIEKLKQNNKFKEKFEKFKESCDGISRQEYRERKAAFLKENNF